MPSKKGATAKATTEIDIDSKQNQKNRMKKINNR